VAFACLVLAVMIVVGSAPAIGHAELTGTSPRDGQGLARAPRSVVLIFSEPVDVVPGGFSLTAQGSGRPVRVGLPVRAGAQVRWPVLGGLPAGGYVVRWRVVSDDGHPVAGAFSFGVKARPGTVAASPGAGWSWPVAAARALGYLGLAMLAGALALSWCWPAGRGSRRSTSTLRAGLVTAVVGTVLGLLLQGPYVAGVPTTRLFDRTVLAGVAHTPFGAWMQLRLCLYLAAVGLLWPAGAMKAALNRRLAAVLTVGAAVTFSGAGHAAASGRLVDRLVDTAHVLCAGLWVGGLVTLVAISWGPREDRPGVEVFARFSRLALTSVLLLLLTGIGNAVLRLGAVSELWESTYGRVLLVKLGLVAAALARAAVSRRVLAGGAAPWRSVRLEAAVTLGILAVTSVLTLLAPPPG
jgi:copper transport protein